MTDDASDSALVRAVLAGDREAFAPLVERHRRAVLVCAFAVTASQAAADDVAQDAFVRAFTKLDTCRDPARFRPWLLAITRRVALNHVRAHARRREQSLDERTPDTVAGPASALDARQTRARLLVAIQQLSPVQREVLVLADLESLPHADIAERTGLSVLMSRRHLSDARRLLRTLLRTRP
jgi:RNA polymerase sigma-70 factor (ECF subfamily)